MTKVAHFNVDFDAIKRLHIQSLTVASQGLSRARVPVLLIYGGKDALVQSKPTMARVVALDPRVQTKLYANSGHAPFLEESERFNRDLSTFVNTLPRH